MSIAIHALKKSQKGKRERERAEIIFKEIMVENLPNLGGTGHPDPRIPEHYK